MKIKMLTGMLCCALSLQAQEDTTGVCRQIHRFFEGMRIQDTVMIRATLDSACTLQSVMQTRSGETRLVTESMHDFLAQVQKLKGQQTDERLQACTVLTDGPLAIAWTPYLFYFNGQFSHCGVNVFTLIKRAGEWKVLSITDTRRRSGCSAP